MGFSRSLLCYSRYPLGSKRNSSSLRKLHLDLPGQRRNTNEGKMIKYPCLSWHDEKVRQFAKKLSVVKMPTCIWTTKRLRIFCIHISQPVIFCNVCVTPYDIHIYSVSYLKESHTIEIHKHLTEYEI